MRLYIKHQHLIRKIPPKAIATAYAVMAALITTIFAFNIDKKIKSVSSNPSIEDMFLIVFLTIVSAVFLLIVGFCLKVAHFQLLFIKYPRYVVYVFEIKPNDYIIGWCTIDIDRINGDSFATGYSYMISSDNTKTVDLKTLVTWESESIQCGSIQGKDSYYIIYNLEPDAAFKQARPYRKGLLMFTTLQEGDMTEKMRGCAIQSGEFQYIGQQQGIDRDGVFNAAYAEQIIPKSSTNTGVADELNELIKFNGNALIQAHKLLKKPYDKQAE
jgi:predicted membrane protein